MSKKDLIDNFVEVTNHLSKITIDLAEKQTDEQDPNELEDEAKTIIHVSQYFAAGLMAVGETLTDEELQVIIDKRCKPFAPAKNQLDKVYALLTYFADKEKEGQDGQQDT